jgi:hypothetical protein
MKTADLRILDVLPYYLVQVDGKAAGPHEGRKAKELHRVALKHDGVNVFGSFSKLRNKERTWAMHASLIPFVCKLMTTPNNHATARRTLVYSEQLDSKCINVLARPRSAKLSMKSKRRPHLRESRKRMKLTMIKRLPAIESPLEICRMAQLGSGPNSPVCSSKEQTHRNHQSHFVVHRQGAIVPFVHVAARQQPHGPHRQPPLRSSTEQPAVLCTGTADERLSRDRSAVDLLEKEIDGLE